MGVRQTPAKVNDPDRHQLNATAASLLGFLHNGPRTGWDLVADVEPTIGAFWSLTRSQVYRELLSMERAGLVKAGRRGPRDSVPFSLTPAGEKAFKEWVINPPGEETIRFPLLLTVLFGAHLPADLLETFLRDSREAHARRLAHYDELIQSAGETPDVYALATVQFGAAYERAVLRWFARVGNDLVNESRRREGAEADTTLRSVSSKKTPGDGDKSARRRRK